LPVDAFSGHPDLICEIALSNLKLYYDGIVYQSAVQPRQPQELARKPCTDTQKNRILDFRLAAAQAFTQNFQERQTNFWPAFDKGKQIRPSNNENVAYHDRCGIVGSWPPIDHGDFTEYVAGLDDIDQEFLAIPRGRAELHPTVYQDHQISFTVALSEYSLVLFKTSNVRHCCELAKICAAKMPQQKMAAQDLYFSRKRIEAIDRFWSHCSRIRTRFAKVVR
jgi:hypothetical protein